MKNLTVSVDEATYTRARVIAASRGSSVSRLVRDYLGQLDDSEGRAVQEWDRLWSQFDAAGARVGDRPTRARTYEDAGVS